MPGQEIDVPNPPPMPSHLPDNVLELAVQIEKKSLPEDVKKGLVDFQRAACYIAAGQYP
jgi:xylulose-5-phosphate/fructose-6-phosphate phosphoketolase